MSYRRTPDPGTEGCLYRYSDTCANCGEPTTGELVGVLADGDAYSWRHKRGFGSCCERRVAECTVHRKVSRWHDCEDGGTVTALRTAKGA